MYAIRSYYGIGESTAMMASPIVVASANRWVACAGARLAPATFSHKCECQDFADVQTCFKGNVTLLSVEQNGEVIRSGTLYRTA